MGECWENVILACHPASPSPMSWAILPAAVPCALFIKTAQVFKNLYAASSGNSLGKEMVRLLVIDEFSLEGITV